jgi:hypothetical protein
MSQVCVSDVSTRVSHKAEIYENGREAIGTE